MSKGTIFLLPVGLGAEDVDSFLPQTAQRLATEVKLFFVENIKISRRFLKSVDRSINIDELDFILTDKQRDELEWHAGFKRIQAGEDAAIMSDAGCPGVADPGSEIVAAAHALDIKVVPLTGPSSILLTLMASGLNGQSFAFNGYLPKERKDRFTKIRQMEALANKTGQTQLFMDTPFRSNHVLEDLIEVCHADRKICVGAAVSTPDEFIKTKTATQWKKKLPNLHKIPVMFAVGQ